MKRKLLLAVATLLLSAFSGVGGSSLRADTYTVDNLTSAGWTQVTASNITGTGDNYYMLVDANSSAYVMSCDEQHFRPCYRTLNDPVANPSFVWMLSGSENTFTLQSVATGAYFKQAAGWNTSMGYSRDDRAIATCLFTLGGSKYTVKCVESNNLVGHWNDDGAAVASDGEDIAANKAAKDAPGFYLYSIPKSDFNAALAASRFSTVSTATKALPADVTSYIQNPEWTYDWGGWESTFTSSGNMQWTGKKAFESWNATNVIVKQELKGVPNGSYKLTADLISGPGATKAAYVYAIGDTKVNSGTVSEEASAGDYGTMASEVAGNTLTADNVSVTNNSIVVGIDQSTGWIVADNFKLYYYGPNLAASDALPVGDMTADTWYYFDIAVAGTYTLTCTTLSDIVYTTDGSILVEDAGSEDTKFDDSSVDLSVGRYYVKSSSAQTLSVTPASYSYEVGDATVSITEGSYLQNLTTVTFAFNGATSNDPGATFELLDKEADATLKKGSSTVTTGTLSLSGKTLTATFSDVTLDLSSSYSIELPANVVGYEGKALNEAVTVNFNTPEVFDGFYYVKSGGLYLSRGANYRTQATADVYGLPVKLETPATGLTKIIFIDNWFNLFDADNGSLYTDNNHDVDFLLEATEGGYYIVNKNTTTNSTVNGKLYIDSANGNRVKVSTTESSVWTFVPCSDASHKARHQALKDAQAAAVATTAGISAASQSALAEALNTNYNANAVDITGTDGTKESYQQGAGNTMNAAELEIYKETVDGLTPGLYKLTVKAFERITWLNDVANCGGAAGLTYLYANDQKVQLHSIMDFSTNAPKTDDLENNGKYYPNSMSGAQEHFNEDQYENTVYVWVTDEGEGTGSITFGINKPHRYGNDGSRGAWICYNNFTLTRYDQTAATMAVNFDAKYGTFCAPFAVTIPGGVTAYSVTGVTGNSLDLEEVSTTIPANKPVVLNAESGLSATTFYGKSVDGTPTNGLLTGVYESTAAPVGSYVLQYNNSKVGFYQVDDVIPNVPANRCYMTIPSSAKAFFFPGDDEATLIEGLDALTAGEYEAIYTMGGVKVNALQKGTNIVQLKSGKTLKINVK